MVNINNLTTNLWKTYFMIFHKSRHKETRPDIKKEVNGHYIKAVEETKFIGVIIDNGFNWQSHIRYIRTKMQNHLASFPELGITKLILCLCFSVTCVLCRDPG